MLILKKVAVTGGISSGKSLVAQFLKDLGAYVVDADEIVHQLLTPDTELGKKIIDLLGKSIVVDGKIDRTRVATKVFLNPKLLQSLEELLHPRVYEEIEEHYQQLTEKAPAATLFVAEIPLLFESGGEDYFDTTVAVIADRELCWERYRKMTGYEREDFNRRMARQLDQHKKAEKADFVLRNDDTKAELRKEVEKLFEILRRRKPKEPATM
ncbi:MAG: dephospho-CoA kinase [Waddliaceae bacterium]